jgi:hypothetical protein
VAGCYEHGIESSDSEKVKVKAKGKVIAGLN